MFELRMIVAWAVVCVVSPCVVAAEAPNIVVILIDDLGYADVPPFGAPTYPTPNISRLAAEGRAFTDFQVSSAVCSASRAALLTGRYHSRVGIHGALGPLSAEGIPANEVTLAEICKQQGYATACFGKWHLGRLPKYLPTRHGFDEYFGLPYSNDMWPHRAEAASLPWDERIKRWPPLPLLENERVVNAGLTAADQRLLTKQYTERAVDFIRRNHSKPFFLYLAHSMVHVPLFVSTEFEGRSGAGLFGDAMAEIDWSVGEIMTAIRSAGIDERTLVLFTSDNGPWLSYGTHAGSAAPLREGKGTSFEGGFRVPALMRWPARIPAGSVCDKLASTIDVLPTVVGLLGAPAPANPLDGRDISPLLFGDADARSPHEAFCYYYADNELQAIRNERWKLHFPHGYRTVGDRVGRSDGLPIPYDDATIDLALFDLETDPSERLNVLDEHQAEAQVLMKAAHAYRQQLGDALHPTSAP